MSSVKERNRLPAEIFFDVALNTDDDDDNDDDDDDDDGNDREGNIKK